MNKVFFGEHGVTSSSATAVANLAAEKRTAILTKIAKVSFYDEFRDLIGTQGGEKKVAAGISKAELNELVKDLEYACKLDSLNAWLREAVKAKEEALNIIRIEVFNSELIRPKKPVMLSLEEFAELFKIELPIKPGLKRLTTEDIINQFSIADYAEYLASNSKSAVYGNQINPDGSFSKALRELEEVSAAPYDISGNLTIRYVPTVDTKEVFDVFTNLSALRRSYQKENNAFNSRIRKALDAAQRKEEDAYYQAVSDYNSIREDISNKRSAWWKEEIEKYEKAMSEYDLAYAKEQTKWNESKDKRLEEVSNWKIVIPKSLDQIFSALDAEISRKV